MNDQFLFDPIKPGEAPLDPHVADLVYLLNRLGVVTESSCDGHGRPGSIVSVSFVWTEESAEKIRGMFPTGELKEGPGRFKPNQWKMFFQDVTRKLPRQKTSKVVRVGWLYSPVDNPWEKTEELVRMNSVDFF